MPRSFQEMLKRRRAAKLHSKEEVKYCRRFTPFQTALHIMMVVSFLALALTGMIIKFPDFGVFKYLSYILGGYTVTGFIHRTAAFITFTYFFLHLAHLVRMIRRKQMTLKEIFIGEHSMVPQKRDFVEFWKTIKWFLGRGPQPEYGRWTYWEKFDYFAVFWGVAVIGFTGLFLWFPEVFTLVFPGSFINVATIIHSDEALLATGFIFTIHFFNTHFRPDRFPMDTVIFTGRVELEEFKRERPREYQYLVDNNLLNERMIEAPSHALYRFARIFGATALLIGLALVFGIVYAMLFVYR
jgi:cytochrome b subunit of formate dehydrogenase